MDKVRQVLIDEYRECETKYQPCSREIWYDGENFRFLQVTGDSWSEALDWFHVEPLKASVECPDELDEYEMEALEDALESVVDEKIRVIAARYDEWIDKGAKR